MLEQRGVPTVVMGTFEFEQLAKLEEDTEFQTASFSPDGTCIVTATDRIVQVWDAQLRNELAKLEGHTDTVVSASFSSDGSRIVTKSDDHAPRSFYSRRQRRARRPRPRARRRVR